MATYTIIDDFVTGNASNPLSGGTGVSLINWNFQADTLAHAQTTAQQFATMFQRQVRLVPVGATGATYTQYVPAAAGSALGNQATGISW